MPIKFRELKNTQNVCSFTEILSSMGYKNISETKLSKISCLALICNISVQPVSLKTTPN